VTIASSRIGNILPVTTAQLSRQEFSAFPMPDVPVSKVDEFVKSSEARHCKEHSIVPLLRYARNDS